MPDGPLSCTGCDYRGFLVFRPITWRITLPTAPRLVPIVKCVGAGVAEMSAIPRQPTSDCPPQTELDALNATFSTPSGYRFKRWASGILGKAPALYKREQSNCAGRSSWPRRAGMNAAA